MTTSTFRVAIGLDLESLAGDVLDYLLGGVLLTVEADTATLVNATLIFTTSEPFDFIERLKQEGFEPDYFRWINISRN